MKHIKKDKRVNIPAKKIEKTGTVFGASFAQKADLEWLLKEKYGMYNYNLFLYDDDLAISLKIKHQEVIKDFCVKDHSTHEFNPNKK